MEHLRFEIPISKKISLIWTYRVRNVFQQTHWDMHTKSCHKCSHKFPHFHKDRRLTTHIRWYLKRQRGINFLRRYKRNGFFLFGESRLGASKLDCVDSKPQPYQCFLITQWIRKIERTYSISIQRPNLKIVPSRSSLSLEWWANFVFGEERHKFRDKASVSSHTRVFVFVGTVYLPVFLFFFLCVKNKFSIFLLHSSYFSIIIRHC